MITATIIKRKTLAPTAPITASKCGPMFSDSDSTKSKLFYMEKNKKSADDKIQSKTFLTDNFKVLNNYSSFFFS